MKKSKNLPIIKIVKIKENKDGSADITFDYGSDFENLVKKHLKLAKMPTKKQINNFLEKCLENTFKEKKPNKNAKVPKYDLLSEGCDPNKKYD